MTLLILTLIFALLVAVFAIQNAATVAINLFWMTTEVPLVLVILCSVLAGAIIVLLIAVWREFRRKRILIANTIEKFAAKPKEDELT
ncbi:MAG: LapA family protein [Bacillota bacterium]|nr:LapA family protein [Bacillota bacterium]MDP4161061.1 LapA family protein [Bacillota bacterium]